MLQRRPFGTWRRSAVGLVVSMLVAGTMLAALAPDTRAQESQGIQVVGELEVPWFETTPNWFTPFRMGWIDRERDRLYMWINAAPRQTHLAEYDLTTDIPTPVRISEDTSTSLVQSFNAVVVDESRREALVLSPVNQTGVFGTTSMIEVFDLETLKLTESIDLSEVVPGFVPTGIRHHPANDRLYLVGEFSGAPSVDSILNSPGKSIGPGPALVSLDRTGFELEWVQILDSCGTILNSSSSGSLVARSIHRPALYVFCAGGAASRQMATGQNSLIRVDLTHEMNSDLVASFAMESFPISGDYVGSNAESTGLVAFDPQTERVFAQSVSNQSAGAWVFDGLRSSWVGFISFDPVGINYGFNEVTGRHYMAGSFSGAGGKINVTDGRSTPVIQGTTFRDIRIFGNLLADPDSNRIFANFYVEEDHPDNFNGSRHAPVMMRDTTPLIEPRSAVDYDSRTSDLPEEDAFVVFNVGASGFGSRYTSAGGWEGMYARFFPRAIVTASSNPASLATGDRGAITSHIGRVGLSQSGADASAAAAATDSATSRDSAVQAPTGEDDGQARSLVQFPYGSITCLDGTGKPVEDRDDVEGSGSAYVRCDFENLASVGAATFSRSLAEGGLLTGSSSANAETFRDPERGVVSEHTAVAEGIAYAIPGVGSFTADKVVTEATTVANGLPDGARARWVRRVENARFAGPLGIPMEPQSCTTIIEVGIEPEESDDCGDIAAQFNELFGPEATMHLPKARVEATPLGAFATVTKAEDDYLNGLISNNDNSRAVPGMQIILVHDGAEKSRTLVQHAAVDAYSIFTRSPLWTPPAQNAPTQSQPPPPATPPDGIAAPAPTVLPPPLAVGPSDAAEPPLVLASHQERLVAAFGWLANVRDLSDGLLTGALYLVLGLPLFETLRRKRLLSVLGREADR